MSLPISLYPSEAPDGTVIDQPLPIVITAAGRENLLFRSLLREVIPHLENPAMLSEQARDALLQTIRTALFVDHDDPRFPDGFSSDVDKAYEPGSLCPWEEWPL